jgi:putative membrane protein
MPDGPTVDYRFLLANERTFLAYVRTALAMQVAGLGVLQFLTSGHSGLRVSLGLSLVLAGSFLGFAGYRRWRENERSIRAGAEMRPARSTLLVAVVIVAFPSLTAILITVG